MEKVGTNVMRRLYYHVLINFTTHTTAEWRTHRDLREQKKTNLIRSLVTHLSNFVIKVNANTGKKG